MGWRYLSYRQTVDALGLLDRVLAMLFSETRAEERGGGPRGRAQRGLIHGRGGKP